MGYMRFDVRSRPPMRAGRAHDREATVCLRAVPTLQRRESHMHAVEGRAVGAVEGELLLEGAASPLDAGARRLRSGGEYA
eukprot:7384697-Prymnesium_polylepis.1